MLTVILSLSAILSGAGVMMLGYGLLGTLVALRMSMDGVPAFVSGVVMAAFFAGEIVGSLYIHHVVKIIGHIRTFSVLASVFSAASLLHLLWEGPFAWGGLRFLEGFCVAGLYMCVESWLNDRATNETRGMVFSIYMVIVYAANAATQFLLIVADVSGMTLFVLTSVLTSLALLPVALTRGPTPSLPAYSAFGIAKLAKLSPLGMAGTMTSGLVVGAFYSLGPRYGEKVGLDISGVAVLIAGSVSGGLLGQLPLGRLSDIVDRRKVIAGVSFMTAILGGVLVLITTHSPMSALPPMAATPIGAATEPWSVDPVLIALVLLFGAMIFTLYPLSVAHANDFIDSSDFVAASGSLLLAFAIGATGGPIMASLLMELFGARGLFLFTALSGLGLCVFALYRLKVAAPVPTDDKTPFAPIPLTSVATASLDPRAEDDQLSFTFDFVSEPDGPS